MQLEGVTFKCNVRIGENKSFKEIHDSYDAIVLACGSEQPRDLKIPGKRFRWCSLCHGFFDQTK